MKRFLIVLFILVCLILVGNVTFLGLRMYKGVRLAEKSKPFCIQPAHAQKSILIIGGGFGVGTGAEHPSGTIAGRIARDYPFAEVVNISEDGAGGADILKQIRSVGDRYFDMILIQAGEREIIGFTNPDDIKGSFSEILHLASRKAPTVIFMGAGNVGLAPAFFPPISWVYTERARSVRELFILLSRETGVEYVDLFRESKDEPMLKDPGGHFAPDMLHPRSKGYAVWYEDLKAQAAFAEILGAR